MEGVLRNRGPDDKGTYIDDKVMLGHNRLSIIDLSSDGQQPMSNEDGSIWISFNGEIYNYKELEKNLKGSHAFRSKTDTEVIIHAYEEMGETLWDKLEGMFAFGLWDTRNKVFYLVRDHYGIKPLYYSKLNGSILFASQMKGIFSLNSFDMSYDFQSLSNYFSYFYIPGPETLVNGIVQLPAGCFLKVTGEDSKTTRYDKLRFSVNNDIGEGKLLNELIKNVQDCVQKSLISDVPVGLLLSGGIDSNILLAEMSNAYDGKISTFTLSVDESSYNEEAFAKEIAEIYNSKHYEESLLYENFDEQLTEIVQAVDCLNANPGLLMKYQFIKMASKHVKVALIGSGGDELFAGYPTYKADAYLPYIQKIPLSIRKAFLQVMEYFPVSYKKYSFNYFVMKFIEGSFYNREKAHYWWRTIFTDDEKIKLLNRDILEDENVKIDASYKYIDRFREIDGCFDNRALYSDFYLFLGDNDLVLSDHLGMHFSLELRPPLLEQSFVGYASTIPYRYKLKSNITKYILRKASRHWLPEKIANRKKHGVIAPLGIIFKNELKSYVREVLSIDNLRDIEILNSNYVQTILSDHFVGKRDNGFKIWALLCFVRWNDIFIKGLNGRISSIKV